MPPKQKTKPVKAKKKAAPAKKPVKQDKPQSIKDRVRQKIKNGAKVYVGDRGGLYVVLDGKKRSVC